MDTLNAALAQAVAQWPTRTFLKIDGLQVSFRDFDEQVGRLAAGLRAAGLKKDDRLVVFMRNSLPCLHSWIFLAEFLVVPTAFTLLSALCGMALPSFRAHW